MRKTLILADDLTGAADCQAQANGVSSRIRLLTSETTAETVANDLREVQMLVLDVETRFLPPGAARASVGQALSVAFAAGQFDRVYMKIDSTLRGNAAEIVEAAAERIGAVTVPVILANPAEGRSTLGGRQFVRGVPLELSPFAADPVHPVTESRISAHLAAGHTDASIRHVLLDELRQNSRGVRTEGARNVIEYVIFDAITDADLDRAAGWVDDMNSQLLCGAAAFARHLGFQAQRAERHNGTSSLPGGGLLCVCGSVNPAATDQITDLQEAWGVEVVTASETSDIGADSEQVRLGLETMGRAILCTERSPGLADPAKLAEKLAKTVRLADPAGLVDAMIVVGGNTAYHVCTSLGIEALDYAGEVSPGLAVCKVADAEGTRRLIALKPGGFGARSALVDAANRLNELVA
jgi:D-threonate/D-erythronate kinase